MRNDAVPSYHQSQFTGPSRAVLSAEYKFPLYKEVEKLNGDSIANWLSPTMKLSLVYVCTAFFAAAAAKGEPVTSEKLQNDITEVEYVHPDHPNLSQCLSCW